MTVDVMVNTSSYLILFEDAKKWTSEQRLMFGFAFSVGRGLFGQVVRASSLWGMTTGDMNEEGHSIRRR